MSIVTKTGDDGSTKLMYGRHVPKTDPRVKACGEVDELNAALGMARANLAGETKAWIQAIQQHLFTLMGALGTLPEDAPRYKRDGFTQLNDSHLAQLDALVAELEARGAAFRGWAVPGANPGAAALDFSRAVCRRAERAVCALTHAGELAHPGEIRYLNRLSDLLWLMARREEGPPT
jgi:cob(I)alamin adenosyltransferase